MACKLDHKSARDNTKQFLVNHGGLRSMQSNEIADLKIFLDVTKQLEQNSIDVYGIKGRPWLVDDNQINAIANNKVLNQIDKKRKELGLYESQTAGQKPKQYKSTNYSNEGYVSFNNIKYVNTLGGLLSNKEIFPDNKIWNTVRNRSDLFISNEVKVYSGYDPTGDTGAYFTPQYNNTSAHIVFDNTYSKEDINRHLRHETIHAYTVGIIQRYRLKQSLNSHEQRFMKELDDLYNIAIQRSNGKYYYGLENYDEFIAEALTNPNFIKFLDTIEIRGDFYRDVKTGQEKIKYTGLDAFLQALYKLFGLTYKPEYKDIFERKLTRVEGLSVSQAIEEIFLDYLAVKQNTRHNVVQGRGYRQQVTQYFNKNNNEVNYQLKVIDLLQSDKANQMFQKGLKHKWTLDKVLNEIGGFANYKFLFDQESLNKNVSENQQEQLVLDVVSNFNYTIEINTAKHKYDYNASDPEYRPDGSIIHNNDPSQYYSNLSVPGGTNYTENEISTPLITPNIKGHAQFSTDNGIGWFRSDDKALVNKSDDNLKFPDEFIDNQGYQWKKINGVWNYFSEHGVDKRDDLTTADMINIHPQKEIFNHYHISKENTKTRRILEVQSDLFQKGRDRSDLVGVDNSLKAQGFSKEEAISRTQRPNKFLQLLNKNNNWVTFFVKSIIQDSAEKGYEKVLFPTGNTASKVEGHETIEEFKKQKENRIKHLENQIKQANTIQIQNVAYIEEGKYIILTLQEDDDIKDEEVSEEKYVQVISKNLRYEINQLKQELEGVERDGFGALKPIYNFYENTVTNILKKQGLNPVLVTDEHGNTWNEITIDPVRDTSNIFLQTPADYNPNYLTPEIHTRLLEFADKAGISVQVTRNLLNSRGVNGIADIRKFKILLQSGKEESLAEEVAHFFVEGLDETSLVYKEMMDFVPHTRIYKEVVQDYKGVYGNDVQKLKKESAAKLIALYMSDKKLFKYWAGKDERLLTRIVRWIKEFLGLVAKDHRYDSFIYSAEKILNVDTTGLVWTGKAEEYYQVDPKSSLFLDMHQFETLGNKSLSNYDRIYVNINDTILDYKGYNIPNKADMFKDPIKNQDMLNTYFKDAKLTNLGKELKDKLKYSQFSGVTQNKITFYTSLPLNNVLVQRLKEEFGDIHIEQINKVDIVENEEGQPITITTNSFSEFKEKNTADNAKVIFIDNQKLNTEGTPSMVFNNARSSYEQIDSKFDRIDKDITRQKRVSKIQDELLTLDHNNITLKVRSANSLLWNSKKNIASLEKKISQMSNEELRSIFKDDNGNTTLPNQMALTVQKGVDDVKKLSRDIETYITTLDSLKSFFRSVRESGLVALKNISNEDLTEEMAQSIIYELNKALSFGNMWSNYVEGVLEFISDKEGVNATRELLSSLKGEIESTEREIKKLGKTVLSKRLGKYLEVYNDSKNLRKQTIEEALSTGQHANGKPVTAGDRKIFEQELETLGEELTTDKIMDILSGKVQDANPLTMWIKTLANSDDPLLASVEGLIKTSLAKVDMESLRQTQEFGQQFMDESKGLTPDDIKSLITIGKDFVYDPKEGKKVLKDRKMLLNRFKNLHEYRERKYVVDQAYQKYLESLKTNENTEENKAAWLQAKSDFTTWETKNWHREFKEEFYNRYEDIRQRYLDIYEEVEDYQRQIYEQIADLRSELISANLEETKNIQKKIDDLRRVLRFQKSEFNEDGTQKDEKGVRIAKMLQEKSQVDYGDYKTGREGVFETSTDHQQFKEDFLKHINAFDIDIEPEVKQTLIALLNNDSGNYAKLIEYAKAEAPYSVIDWLETNTNVRYSDKFYESRQVVLDQIETLIDQINKIQGIEDDVRISDLWKDIFALSSPYRDADGIIHGESIPLQVQSKISDFESEIERIKNENDNSLFELSNAQSELKNLRISLKVQIQKLKELQSKNPTSIYSETLETQLVDSGFNEVLNDTSLNWANPISFINSDSFTLALENNPDHPFVKWFNANHIFKIQGYDLGSPVYGWMPNYTWMKVTPNDKEHIESVPSHKYSKRKVKDSFITPKVNNITWSESLQQYLPKSADYMSAEYEALMNRNDSKGLQLQRVLKLVTDFHFQTQTDSLYDARIGWFLPSVQKRTLEGNPIKNFVRDFLDTQSRFEEGEGNYMEDEMEGKPLSWKDAKKANLIKSWKKFQEGFSMNKEVRYDSEGKPIVERGQSVAVHYSSYMSPEIASDDLLTMMMMYRSSVNNANEIVDLIPTHNLVKKIIENDQNQENRLKALQFQSATRFYGQHKVYEVPKSIDKIATGIRKINSFGSLGDVTGVFNNIKNNLQGRLQNFINADFADWSTVKSMRQAASYPRNNMMHFFAESEKDLNKRSIDYHIMAFFNPGIEHLYMFLSPGAGKRYGSKFVGQLTSSLMEYAISANALYAHLFHKKVEREVNGGKEVKILKDVLIFKDGKLQIEEGWVDAKTKKPMNEEYLIRMKTTFKSILEYTQGKVGDKVYLSTTTIGQSLLYFKNWFIPTIRRRFDKKRANYMIGEDVEGYWRAFIRMSYNMIKNLKENGEANWQTFTDQEKSDYMTTVREIGVMISTTLLLALLFGFDPNDKDKFKKVRNKSYLEQSALLLTLQAKNETEAFSLMPYFNIEHSMMPSVYTEGTKFILSPFMGMQGLIDLGKAVQNSFYLFSDAGYYDRDMPRFNIEKGDSKAGHYLIKVLQIDDFLYIGNPEGKIENLIGNLKR